MVGDEFRRRSQKKDAARMLLIIFSRVRLECLKRSFCTFTDAVVHISHQSVMVLVRMLYTGFIRS